eukprot:GDKJ01043414.1.p1 GENE.GDKJ01043414.1~~GDKJ01043414.1.p1  ORF type:complete len:207 (-),score=46.74 GDKJ01043414.1:182-778(-)
MGNLSKMAKPEVLFVLGGPGAGKGTQCANLEQRMNYIHVSAGDCLREELSKPDSKEKDLIDSYIKNGLIVPVEITVNLLKKKMISKGWEKSKFLIDGFPRNQENLDGWRNVMGEDVDVLGCVFFDCSEEVMESRLLKRGLTSGRSDDNIESIRKRFNVFKTETMPIINYFKEQDKMFMLNADQDPEKVWEDLVSLIPK